MNNRQKWRYPMRGFLWGFGIAVVALGVSVLAEGLKDGQFSFDRILPRSYSGERLLEDVGIALAIALGAGLIGMLVGMAVFEKAARRYLLKGFLWGFGILAVPTLLLLGLVIIPTPRDMSQDYLGAPSEYALLILAWGLGISVGTGLIGMLIGYIKYRKELGRKQPGPSKCGECGYSLVGLTGDKCPECGHTVSATATA